MRYAQLCLDVSQGDDIPPFYLGFAYEALARAESIVGDQEKVEEYIDKARDIAAQLTNEEEKKMLEKDLDTIQ